MGDFNAVVGNVADNDTVRKYGLGTRNERGSRLVKLFCKQNSCVTSNTFFEVPLKRRYTWTAPGDTARYQLDYILVKSRYKNQVKYSPSFPGAEIDSDHKLVMMECRVTLGKSKNRPKYKAWDLNKLKMEEIRTSYAHKSDRIAKKKNEHSRYVGRSERKYHENCRKIDWMPKTCSEETMDNKLNYGINKTKKQFQEK